MSVRSLMLTVAVWTHQLHAHDLRDEEHLRYIVGLFGNGDDIFCFGTLISSNWVLTAANCLSNTKSIQYGNLSIPFNESSSIRKVLLTERPRSSMVMEPDLGLIYINSVPMSHYGQLSAVDYKAMAGHIAEYTDFEASQNDYVKEGVVSTCNADDKVSTFAAYLCVAPKCSEKQQLSLPGEPGTPLFFDGKVAGVHVGDGPFLPKMETKLYVLRTYTPISPYLSWLHRTIREQKEFISRRSADHEYHRYRSLPKLIQDLKDELRRTYRYPMILPLLQPRKRRGLLRS